MLLKELFQRKLFYLFAFGFLIRLVLAWLPERYFYYLISDDAYYYFSIARNLVSRGMLSADGITLTNGFHPLWLFVITPIFFFFQKHPWFSIHLVLTVSAVFDTLAAFLIYKTLERLGKEKTGFWAAAFYLVNPWGLLHTMNGLETAQNNFFLALLVYLSVCANREWLKTSWFFFGAVCGLALLSRTDNVFAVTILMVYLLWGTRNFLPVAKSILVALSLISSWLVYNFITFGTLIQTSGTAYPWHYHQQYLNEHKTYFSSALVPFLLKMGFYNFAENAFHYGSWILALVIAGILLYRLRNWPERYRPLLWTLIATALFAAFHIFIRWSVRPWYSQAVFVMTLPLVALTLEKVNRNLIALGFIFSILAGSFWIFTATRFKLADRSKVMMEMIYTKVPSGEVVGAFNSGYLQYFTDRRVINLDGLANNEVLSYYKSINGLEYFRRKDIRWLIDTPAYLAGLFGSYFGSKAESSLFLIDVRADISYPKNNVALVAVLPEGRVSPPGRDMPIMRDYAAQRRWGKVPLPFVRYKMEEKESF